MQYSPKLKIAMLKIKEIMRESDIAGFVVLHTPGFSEYINQVETSYSCAKLEGNEMRFKINSKEVGKEKARELARDTLNMLSHIARAMVLHGMSYVDAEKLLNDKFGGEDLPGTETSHIEQNN